MSDWLLQGVDPRGPAGREFYLHTADEWFDIVAIVDQMLRPFFPLPNDNPLGWLEDRDCLKLADHLDFFIDSGIAAEFLEKNRAYRGVETLTLDNLRKFSSFLKACGGFLADCA
jgi:hypothetical protein